MKFFVIKSVKWIIGWIAFLLIWFVFMILHKSPYEVKYKFMLALQNTIFWLNRNGRARIKRNISLIRPDLTKDEISEGYKTVIRTIARSWTTIIEIRGKESITEEDIKNTLTVDGEIEEILEYHHSGKKIVVVIPHIGPVDAMFGVGTLYELKIFAPVEAIKPRQLFNLITSLRTKVAGDIIIEPVERKKTLSRSAHFLSNGRIVVLAIDIIKKSGGVSCRIGNGVANFPVGAAKLALEEDAIIWPVFPSWGNDQKSKMIIGKPFFPERTGNMNHDIEVNTRRLIEEVFAPFIQDNWDTWVRLAWADLKSVDKRS